ncbi:hypothetical protein HAALTHF_44060n [Vreelandella aquamarina]|nr:hypothetical protein HAALTHF_44060n [Halomonas axialensis]
MSYRHILVAVDLTKDSHKILERAVAIAERNNGAKISIIHSGTLGIRLRRRYSYGSYQHPGPAR